MDERAAFEANIDRDPLDHLNHLVYADWLDDHGEHDEAAFRRSMGEWIGKSGVKPQRPYTGRHKSVVRNKMSWWIPEEMLPDFAPDRSHFSHWQKKPVSQWSFRSDGTGYFPKDPTDFAWEWANHQQGKMMLGWEKYRHMEEAFRRAFMKGRNQQPEQLSRITRVVRRMRKR